MPSRWGSGTLFTSNARSSRLVSPRDASSEIRRSSESVSSPAGAVVCANEEGRNHRWTQMNTDKTVNLRSLDFSLSVCICVHLWFRSVRRRERDFLITGVERGFVDVDEESIFHVLARADLDLDVVVVLAGLVEGDAHAAELARQLGDVAGVD